MKEEYYQLQTENNTRITELTAALTKKDETIRLQANTLQAREEELQLQQPKIQKLEAELK